MSLRPLALLVWLASFVALPAPAGNLPARRLQGEIAGARWAALVPDNWNNRLLLLAPDRRNAPDPLAATLDETAPDNEALLDAGWALATSSYRRTGPILVDAIEDLRSLREQLAEELGAPAMTVVAGRGMGGLITVLLAERHADEFHAFLAHDPRFAERDPRALRLRCDGQPRGPMLLLFGIDTARDAIAYHDRARDTANAESVVPALWFHSSDTEDAKTAPAPLPEAVSALVDWVRSGQPPADRLEHLPAAEDPPPAAPETPPAPAPRREAPPLPEEPPPSVPVES